MPLSKNQRVQGINQSLQLNWERLPAEQALVTSIGPPDDASRRLILVTATYPHTLQPLKLRNCARMLAPEPNVLWIVVEDATSPSPAIAALLNGSAASAGLKWCHAAHLGDTTPKWPT